MGGGIGRRLKPQKHAGGGIKKDCVAKVLVRQRMKILKCGFDSHRSMQGDYTSVAKVAVKAC